MARGTGREAADIEDEAAAQQNGTNRAVYQGCSGIVLALVLGFVVMTWQDSNILDTWTYCSDQATEVAVDTSPHSAVEVGIDLSTLRILGYTASLCLGFGLGRLVMWGRPRGAAIAVGCLLAAAVCAAVFVGDFAVNNGEAPGFYFPGLCPGGRPPWWPSWLPMRVG
ncbi:hypothetical protein OH807_40420 [Kitasatospora sp. NBC_01560]|uniref:hypothetical protein n=1 Tax=Kitasatospora sp. NBC_01560 TaxID=2975965 RepID=UPI00386D70F7